MVLGVPRSSVSTSDHPPKLATDAITNLELQMFTSINTTNSCYYYNNTDQSPILDRSVSNNDVNPNFKYNQPPLPSSFNPFSPTCFDSNNEDNNIQFFQQHQDIPMSHYPQHHHHHPSTTKDNDVNVDMDAGGSAPSLVDLIPRKKASKKDRHSKIATAQGLRDRRMRLNLEIARKFFTLQDMLGFDKASKTVDWLLTNAKTAIKELSRDMSDGKHSCSGSDKSVSSISECEVISGIDENNNNEDLRAVNISGVQQSAGAIKERRARQTRKPTFHPNAKEYRTMARARARERTMGKMPHKSQQSQETGNLSFKQLKSSSSLEKGEESRCQSHEFMSSLDRLSEIEPTSQEPGNGIMDAPFTITNKGNQSSIFTYNPEIAISQGVSSSNFSFPNFASNWGMDSARTTSSYSSVIDMNLSSGNVEENIPTSFPLTAPDSGFQPQYADIQSYKLWEPFNHQGQFQR